MNVRKIRGSQWWFAILAFLAGIAVHAVATGHRPIMAEPTTTLATPVSYDSPAHVADASSDTCEVQLD